MAFELQLRRIYLQFDLKRNACMGPSLEMHIIPLEHLSSEVIGVLALQLLLMELE